MVVEPISKEKRNQLLTAARNQDVVICAHDNADVDAMVSAEIIRRILFHENIEAKIVRRTPADADSLEIIEREGLLRTPDSEILEEIPNGASIVLCDWFFIPGEESADIIAVFDHHPTDAAPDVPVFFDVAASSTSRLLYQLFLGSNIDDFAVPWSDKELDEVTLGTLYASFVDTNGLKSTRTDPDDFPWMDLVIIQYGLDKRHLTEVGMCLTDLSQPIEKLIRNGEKNYVLPNGKRAFMSYIIVNGHDNQLDRPLREELEYVLRHGTDRAGDPFDYAWHMVCDLGCDKTYVCKTRKLGGSDTESYWDEYAGNLSRARDIYPMLERDNQL